MATGGPIRALVFDIGQVIVRVNAPRAAQALAEGTDSTAQEAMEGLARDARMRDFQEGRLTPQQWHVYLASRLGFRHSFERFCEIWNSALERETILNQGLFAELAQNCRLVLLSNIDPIHAAFLESQFVFMRHFPARVYSCAVGVSKPAAAIYDRAIAVAGAAPGEILYIDDVAEYAEAGRGVGMQVHEFRDRATLMADFRARKLLT